MSNKAKGDYQPYTDKYVQPRRLPRYARERKPEREVSDGGPSPFISALLVLFLMAGAVSTCNAQNVHFHFNTSTIIMQDTAGETTVGSASWPVRAWCDSLRCGPLQWYGIKWQRMDSGALYFIAPGFMAKYLPGPGGKSLAVYPSGAIKSMEFHEKTQRQ